VITAPAGSCSKFWWFMQNIATTRGYSCNTAPGRLVWATITAARGPIQLLCHALGTRQHHWLIIIPVAAPATAAATTCAQSTHDLIRHSCMSLGSCSSSSWCRLISTSWSQHSWFSEATHEFMQLLVLDPAVVVAAAAPLVLGSVSNLQT
jgi:hypothetical protein